MVFEGLSITPFKFTTINDKSALLISGASGLGSIALLLLLFRQAIPKIVKDYFADDWIKFSSAAYILLGPFVQSMGIPLFTAIWKGFGNAITTAHTLAGKVVVPITGF